MVLNRSPNVVYIGSTVQYIGENPTAKLYAYINHHAGKQHAVWCLKKNQDASSLKTLSGQTCFKENLNASRPSEHPPVKGENVKTLRWDHRLQRQNILMTFNRVPRWWWYWVNSIISGRNPPLFCTLTKPPCRDTRIPPKRYDLFPPRLGFTQKA